MRGRKIKYQNWQGLPKRRVPRPPTGPEEGPRPQTGLPPAASAAARTRAQSGRAGPGDGRGAGPARGREMAPGRPSAAGNGGAALRGGQRPPCAISPRRGPAQGGGRRRFRRGGAGLAGERRRGGAGAAMEARPIVTSKQREEVVHGVPTEVVCTAFSNSVLVVVTQYGKMGTIVYVDPNTVGDNVGRPSLTTKVLLGKDEPLVHVCAKNLVAFVSQEAGNKPVLLAMALKDKTVEGIQALREVIRSCQVW